MLLIGCSLALLVIYAGMKLLAQTKKESLGNVHKYVSWFLVIMGFLLVIGTCCSSIMHLCHKDGRIKGGEIQNDERTELSRWLRNEPTYASLHDNVRSP